MNNRYLPQNLKSTYEVEVMMLPGVGFESDAVFIGGLTISKMEFIDWHLIEKNQFSDDLFGRLITDNPYFFIFASDEPDSNEQIINYRSEQRQHVISLFISTLRLFYPNRIENATDFINYKRIGSNNIRNPNRFGREGYNISTHLVIRNEDLQVIEGLFYSLSLFDRSRQNISIALGRHLFSVSYDLAISGEGEQALFLLSSLEALVGKYTDRLMTIPWTNKDIYDFLKNYRSLRNSIAHGKADTGIEYVEILREIVRALIREAISYQLLYPDSQEATGKFLIERLKNPDYLGPHRLSTVAGQCPNYNNA